MYNDKHPKYKDVKYMSRIIIFTKTKDVGVYTKICDLVISFWLLSYYVIKFLGYWVTECIDAKR